MKRLSLFIVIALIAVACGGDSDADNGEPTISTPAYTAFRTQTTACGSTAPPPARSMQFTEPQDEGLTESVLVTIATSCGPIVLELIPEIAPQTVNSFVFLARQGYFDGTAMHRILPGFVIQAGDPTAEGAGSPGYRLPDELPPADFIYGPGVIAMANSGPNSSGSQFFIVLGETTLPAAYTVFGLFVEGIEAVNLITAVPLGPNQRGEMSRPFETVYIETVTVEG